MKQIELGGKRGKGLFALVDDEDYDELNKYKWYLSHGYAETKFGEKGNKINVYMHRLIMKTPLNMECDHWDGNTLNSQKYKLTKLHSSSKFT